MGEKIVAPIKVTIDISCLADKQLTADLYIILHWKYHGGYELPWTIKALFEEDTDDYLEHLQEQEYIKITGNGDFELRQKAINLFETQTPNVKWAEFLGNYPIKVPNGKGGYRILKTGDPNARGNEKIKAKYFAIIKKDPDIHDKIVNALKKEVSDRKASGDLQYMQNIQTWLNQHTYEKYICLPEDSIEDTSYENEDYM
jgi:hypothetical protein